MTIDERIEALTMNLELQARDSETLREYIERNSQQIEQHSHQLAQDAENIRALARIAEAHENRLTHVEDRQH